MPDGFIPNEGLSSPIARILNPVGADHNAWRLIFWVNNFTPTKSVTLSMLTEATWGGYTFVTLDATQWTAATVTGNCAKSTYGTTSLTWTVTNPAGQTNYGYALVDPAAGVIRWIQRFDPADIQALSLGAQVNLLPQYTLTSAAC